MFFLLKQALSKLLLTSHLKNLAQLFSQFLEIASSFCILMGSSDRENMQKLPETNQGFVSPQDQNTRSKCLTAGAASLPELSLILTFVFWMLLRCRRSLSAIFAAKKFTSHGYIMGILLI
jgi:hypothetical protein